MTESLHYIYRHIRPDTNEVFYVGIGKEDSRRAWESRRRTDFWNKVVEKNSGKYRVDILCSELSRQDANEKEKEFIVLYGRRKNATGTLVNFQKGGSYHTDWRMSEEEKKKVSALHKGNRYAKGNKWTEAAKLKMSMQRKGRKNPFKGKTLPEAWRKNQSLGHIGNPSHSGKFWINNGTISTLLLIGSEIPLGFTEGRIGWKLSEEFCKELSKRRKGKKFNLTPQQRARKSERMSGNKYGLGRMWINNGINCKFTDKNSPLPEGYIQGRLKKLNNN